MASKKELLRQVKSSRDLHRSHAPRIGSTCGLVLISNRYEPAGPGHSQFLAPRDFRDSAPSVNRSPSE